MIIRRARPGDEAALAAPYREMRRHSESSDPPGGAGIVLPRAMAQLARDEGYCSVDWTTDPGNLGAWLHDHLGVPRQDKVFHRLAGTDLMRLAADG